MAADGVLPSPVRHNGVYLVANVHSFRAAQVEAATGRNIHR